MKFKIRQVVECEIDVAAVRLELPVRYGTEDIPDDFPGRNGELWVGTVELREGGAYLRGWPAERGHFSLHMKVCDSGSYCLLSPQGDIVAAISEDYVPHGVVPGDYGDYVVMDIAADGRVRNWPAKVDVGEFFEDEG